MRCLPAFEIVRIGLEDWPKCGAIWNMETFPYTEQFREQIRAGNREVFVLTVDGAYIAECDLVKDNPEYGTIPGRRLYLSRLIVRRDRRGQGYGRALTAHLLDLARKRGYREIALGVDRDNAPALGLYRSLGFAVYEEAEDRDGEFYRMEKTLGA